MTIEILTLQHSLCLIRTQHKIKDLQMNCPTIIIQVQIHRQGLVTVDCFVAWAVVVFLTIFYPITTVTTTSHNKRHLIITSIIKPSQIPQCHISHLDLLNKLHFLKYFYVYYQNLIKDPTLLTKFGFRILINLITVM